MAERASRIYVPDISYGTEEIVQRGHWIDRLPDIDRDLAAMREALAKAVKGSGAAAPAIERVLGPSRPTYFISHSVPEHFSPGRELPIALTTTADVQRCDLFFRHVNQAERWRSMPMQSAQGRFAAAIGGDFTASPFPVQYYFALSGARGSTLAPGFDLNWAGQPYHSVGRTSAS